MTQAMLAPLRGIAMTMASPAASVLPAAPVLFAAPVLPAASVLSAAPILPAASVLHAAPVLSAASALSAVPVLPAVPALLAAISEAPPPGFESGLLYQIWLNLFKADRYKLIIDGLAVTVQVAVFAVALGVVLGFFTALMKLSKLAPLRAVATIYVSIIRGTPIVLQLMIIYFVVFASSPLPKVLIVIISFGLNSGAYASEIFRAGVLSVDAGQVEAGRSLGLSSAQTMRLIVLPQAIKNALPSLGNEFILLLKETSVVGYIGMQDMTKAGDIIRARTYSPFLPLVTVAIIYLVIVLTLSRLLSKLERRLRRGDTH